MITSPAFAGRRYAVLGLARSGLATVDALVASGAEVVAWDEREEARHKVKRKVEVLDLELLDFTRFDGLLLSPGVPLNTHPLVAKAQAAGVPILGDIELFAQARASLPPHRVVAITGTNGKSTTTALIHHIVKTAGLPAMLGGNIGLPILAQEPLPTGGVYVLELSSFQIDLTHSLDCDVAVLLNITPDHLDRHGDMAGYAAAKAWLFEMQSADNVAVIVGDDDYTREIAFNEWTRRGKTWDLVHGKSDPEQAQWPALQGPHNAQNAAAAIAATRALGIADDVIAKALRTYPGLPHRMERVATKRGVLYVNDSKATNPTSAAPALAAYPGVHWILGGVPKTDDLDACALYFDHIRAAYTIGQAGPMYAEVLGLAGISVRQMGTLEAAVVAAAEAAAPGEAVLLSPACASFDQFADYEARGRAFIAAVGELPS